MPGPNRPATPEEKATFARLNAPYVKECRKTVDKYYMCLRRKWHRGSCNGFGRKETSLELADDIRFIPKYAKQLNEAIENDPELIVERNMKAHGCR